MRKAETYRKPQRHTHTYRHTHTHLQWACTSKRSWTRPSCMDFIAAGIISLLLCLLYKESLLLTNSLMSPWLWLCVCVCARARRCLRFKKVCAARRRSVCVVPGCTDLSRNAAGEHRYPLHTLDHPHCKHRDIVCVSVCLPVFGWSGPRATLWLG